MSVLKFSLESLLHVFMAHRFYIFWIAMISAGPISSKFSDMINSRDSDNQINNFFLFKLQAISLLISKFLLKLCKETFLLIKSTVHESIFECNLLTDRLLLVVDLKLCTLCIIVAIFFRDPSFLHDYFQELYY